MIQPERIRDLNTKPVQDGKYVLYWMQAAQRADHNQALEFALQQANKLNKPLVALFCIADIYPEANERHYYFMLEGLREVSATLQARGIQIVIRRGMPAERVPELAADAAMVVVDDGYLRIQRRWRRDVGRRLKCAFFEITTNLIVPATEASAKEEFSGGTFRPRITGKLDSFLVGLRHRRPKVDSLSLKLNSLDIGNIDKVIARLDIDRSVRRVTRFSGGTGKGKKRLQRFFRYKLKDFGEKRNDPCAGCVSDMSPYLHFGQISPLYIALKVLKRAGAGVQAYMEELIVRRELSHNFVFYNKEYDKFSSLPPWAKRTLLFHGRDRREYLYSQTDFERAKTHDPYWNAAQKQMVLTGKMHGYMRMYWGKKLLEWSRSPHAAFKTALYLNNRYELDGRDANGFGGVAWCFGKHDRAWAERPVLGKVRYMNAAGLKRKFDADAYVRMVQQLENGA